MKLFGLGILAACTHVQLTCAASLFKVRKDEVLQEPDLQEPAGPLVEVNFAGGELTTECVSDCTDGVAFLKKGRKNSVDEDGKVMLEIGEGSVSIRTWYGRMGNNILQILSAIIVGQMLNATQLKFLVDIHHIPILNLPVSMTIQPAPAGRIREPKCILQGNYFGKCVGLTKGDYRQIIKDHLVQFLKPDLLKKCSTVSEGTDGLTVHLRTGDLLVSSHFQSKFAPCSFFDHIIITQGFEEVHVVSESLEHPCINLLSSRHKNVKVHSHGRFFRDKLSDDVCHLLYGKNVAIGAFSTFSEVLVLFNTKLERYFVPGACECHNGHRTADFPVSTFCYNVPGLDTIYPTYGPKMRYITKTKVSSLSVAGVCDESKEHPFYASVGPLSPLTR